MDLMYIHILQCFRTCGAESTTAFCYTEGGCYCCFCYSVIPGWDQESYDNGL